MLPAGGPAAPAPPPGPAPTGRPAPRDHLQRLELCAGVPSGPVARLPLGPGRAYRGVRRAQGGAAAAHGPDAGRAARLRDPARGRPHGPARRSEVGGAGGRVAESARRRRERGREAGGGPGAGPGPGAGRGEGCPAPPALRWAVGKGGDPAPPRAPPTPRTPTSWASPRPGEGRRGPLSDSRDAPAHAPSCSLAGTRGSASLRGGTTHSSLYPRETAAPARKVVPRVTPEVGRGRGRIRAPESQSLPPAKPVHAACRRPRAGD